MIMNKYTQLKRKLHTIFLDVTRSYKSILHIYAELLEKNNRNENKVIGNTFLKGLLTLT